MRVLSRRTAVFAISLFAMAACGASGDEMDETGKADAPSSAALQEITMGSDDAPVTITEYASWTCPHCLHFNDDVISKMKEKYVKTGKVKFVFREFPTAPAEISVAGFAIARCAGEDQYLDVLDELFSRQTAILSLARQGGRVESELQQIAANHGISDEAEYEACLSDSGIRKAISASVIAGEADNVTATPTVLMNGEPLEGFEWRRWDGMQAVLDEALGEDAPAAESTPAAADTASDNDMGGESTPQ